MFFLKKALTLGEGLYLERAQTRHVAEVYSRSYRMQRYVPTCATLLHMFQKNYYFLIVKQNFPPLDLPLHSGQQFTYKSGVVVDGRIGSEVSARPHIARFDSFANHYCQTLNDFTSSNNLKMRMT